jgi:hypothetical protein
VQLVLEAKARGIRLRSKEDDSSLESVLMAAAMGERNTEDSRRKGAAVSKGMARRLKDGKPIGGHSFGLGRRRNQETDELETIPDPDKAPIVVRIYDEYLSGKTQQGIIKRLNAEGIPSMKGGKWHSSTLRGLLKNPVYAGLVRDGDELIEGSFEAIIPRERWEDAQRLRRRKEKPTSAAGTRTGATFSARVSCVAVAGRRSFLGRTTATEPVAKPIAAAAAGKSSRAAGFRCRNESRSTVLSMPTSSKLASI